MKTLNEYFRACGDLAAELIGDGNTMIDHVTNDSRKVRPGSLFVAIRGSLQDGRKYLDDAVNRGAAAVMYQDVSELPVVLPSIRVFNDYEAYGRIAECHFDYPANDMRMVGITGTNGKTTTALLVAAACEAAGMPTGVIGTLGARTETEWRSTGHTTPEAPDLYARLDEMRTGGRKAAVIEVSSHALVLKRVEGIEFDVAVFTKRAEILVAAVGVPNFVQPEMVRLGAVVVSDGISWEGKKLLADVDESVGEVASWITPRLGGVGPTTVAMLMRNTVEAAERRAGL